MIKQVIMTVLVLVLFTGVSYADLNGIRPSTSAIDELIEKSNAGINAEYLSKIHDLETQIRSLLRKVEKLEAVKKVPTPIVDRGVSILVPDAKYMGNGKYCYPSEFTGVVGEYKFNCE